MDDKNALFLTKGWGNFLVKNWNFQFFQSQNVQLNATFLEEQNLLDAALQFNNVWFQKQSPGGVL